MAFDNVFTKKELLEMWKRPVERQYTVAISKIFEAITATNGDITISFSGGKDSTLLLDMYCEIVSSTQYADKPIKVMFADTTNETSAMKKFIKEFIQRCRDKYGVDIDFRTVRPEGVVWASFVKENGIPLISKAQSKCIRTIKRDMLKTGCDYQTVKRLFNGDKRAVDELFDIGFSKTGVLSLTGWVSSRQEFGKRFMISKVWLPMICCPVDLTEQCCVNIKEKPLHSIPGTNHMTGEQAMESLNRESEYLKTGCNIKLPNGTYRSKPFGAMTTDGVLFAIKYRNVPICPDYGEIVQDENGHYRCTKSQRTGCALCGFGCQYDTERFVRLQETEPAKVRFAFKPKSEGGAGYKEAIEYMNEYCGTNVIIPKV